MLAFDLLVAVVWGFIVLGGVRGAPSPSYSVSLNTCETPLNATETQCATACEPIFRAQSECGGLPFCTCATAPAEAVQECLQCFVDSRSTDNLGNTQYEIPLRLQTYDSMCNTVLKAREPKPLPEFRLPEPPSSPTSNHTLVPREGGGICIYGLPDVVPLSTSALSPFRSPWFLLAFAVVLLFYVFQAQGSSPTSQA